MKDNQMINAEKELMSELMKGEQSGKKNGWTDFADVKKELNNTNNL